MPRKLTKTEARRMSGERKAHRGGKPKGVRIPCGACGAHLTATEWRVHFTACPKRPAAAA